MSPRPKLADLVAPELRPYITYSFGLHVALAVAALQILGLGHGGQKSTVYTIDFVGGPGNIVTSAGPTGGEKAPPPPAAAAAAAPARAVAPSGEFDEFGRRRRHGPLPRPSLLRGAQAPREQEEVPAEKAGTAPTTSAPGSAAATGGGGAGDAGVSADMPNFPYPWYITLVRQRIWSQWQSRMPRGEGECVIVFSILRNGSVVDLRTETSSGDSAFDITALAVAQDAGPYQPLPREFQEPFLKVHVTLRSQ